MNGTRKIIHVDMDCFYAAVEVKYRPELRGKALGIGGSADLRSGVLCTANYEARQFKVRSAMSSAVAMRLCPSLILIPPHFELYKAESRAVREIFSRHTSLIEPLSLDEAYLDVTDSKEFGGSASLIAQEIRRSIESELNLTASAGIAPNKFLAKIASDWKKPNGQFVIRPADIEAFMPPLPIEKLWGVGKVTAKKMHGLGLRTCGDIQKWSVEQLTEWFGSRGLDLWKLARGIDHREVDTSSGRKSLTVEDTFSKDLSSFRECAAKIPTIYEDWERRMLRANLRDQIRGWVVKLKFYDFKSTTHETTTTDWPSVRDFERLLLNAWGRRGDPVRLIGLGVRLHSDEKRRDVPPGSVDESGQLSFAV